MNWTFKKRVEHIYEYYKFHILGVIIGLYCVFGLLNHFILNPPKDPYVSICLHGEFLSYDTQEKLHEFFLPLVDDVDHPDVEIYNIYFTENPQENMTQMEKFTAMIMSQTIDVIILEQDVLADFIEQELLLPLSDETYAISLANNPALNAIGIHADKYAVGIVANSKRVEQAKRVISFLQPLESE